MINKISFADNKKYYLNDTPINVNKDGANFTHSYLEHSDLTLKQKATILGTSALGMALPLAFLSKKAGFSLNPVKIFKTPIKDWALFKYKPVDKVLEFDEGWKIISVAAGSVAGGFAGGALVDKNNLRAKKREVLSQLLGDVIVPISCVWAGAKIFKHYEKTLQKLMPKISKDTKFANVVIIAGNKVSNEINEKLYKMKVERGIKATDFAPHVDDLCLSISMVNSGSTLGTLLGRVIPFALLVPGYETGTAREK